MSIEPNKLFTGDNLHIMNGMNSESVDLIYLDPPFNSKRTYSAPVGSKAAGASFKDMWTWNDVDKAYLEGMIEDYPYMPRFIESIGVIHGKSMASYLTYMAQRLIEMRRLLKDTGSIYLHCDPTASHSLKLVMDIIFGKNNFQNEIVWCYKSGGATKKRFARKHDVILFYSKGGTYTFNYAKEKSYGQPGGGQGGKVVYLTDAQGTYSMTGIKDWWQISMLSTTHSERTGYPTQKPLALLHRIIQAGSNKGDIVFDPFCGCATTCVAAEHLDRRWIGIDIEEQAARVLVDRLSDTGGFFGNFVHLKSIPERTDIDKAEFKLSMPDVKNRLYGEQEKTCNGCRKDYDIKDLEIDHKIPRAKMGGDYISNFQLLCGNCNRIKGDRPMDYLRMKISAREKHMKYQVTFGE